MAKRHEIEKLSIVIAALFLLGVLVLVGGLAVTLGWQAGVTALGISALLTALAKVYSAVRNARKEKDIKVLAHEKEEDKK